MRSFIPTLAILVVAAGAAAQTTSTWSHHTIRTKQHVITKGDVTAVQACHVIYLNADDAFRQEQGEKGSARLTRPQRSTAYDCYTIENPVY